MEIKFNDFLISDNKALLDLKTIKDFLRRSYWANRRTEDNIERSIENSICYGVYHEGKQVGYARIITDHATMYYLCDVFIDEAYRGNGIGKKLLECITTSDDFRNLTGVLRTQDAQGLYQQFDFVTDSESFMVRKVK
ncbi:N-acetyltransferase [Paenibacillus albiflavus]|uniref:N-acetyltransferase n=1 Tax=Paenibacillus albiflavus TaxID=2545760 RepID=A0A4R4EQU0_9BACL|nr:GNAT family N-acetyltransferase [Paenibacillus albiflavus]TCZ80875.1 N-acetyltransferase [Paenibacillus albiflavus]